MKETQRTIGSGKSMVRVMAMAISGSRSQREPFQLLTRVGFNVDGNVDGKSVGQCEVLPRPASWSQNEPLHKAGNTNISLVQFFGDVSNRPRNTPEDVASLSRAIQDWIFKLT
jgi:hypothetical protein